MCLPDLLRELGLREQDQHSIAEQAAAHTVEARRRADQAAQSPADKWDLAVLFMGAAVPVPHPAAVTGQEAPAVFLRGLYLDMGARIYRHVLPEMTAVQYPVLEEILIGRLPALAVTAYQAEFVGMAIDYQPFLVWSMLQDQAGKDALLRRLGDELRAAGEDSQLRFELLGAAVHQLDLGLDAALPGDRRPAAAVGRGPASTRVGSGPRGGGAAPPLRRRSRTAGHRRPLRPARRRPAAAATRATPPPTSRRPTARYVTRRGRRTWNATRSGRAPGGRRPGPRDHPLPGVPYGAQAPLLILGHPGSGKSLLTKVYAARLEYPRYTVVRVELRDADPTVSIQKQVEDQIRKDTGYDVNWADLADNLPFSPPVVILDGYDELLQATGKLFTDYLDQVQRFQRDALIQNRPVRVIVTSRITLIDKAIIPPGTTVMRLEPFDEPRRAEWITRWNAYNAGYFQQSGVKPFTLPDNEGLAELAEQPLLLLMLAIFDSAGNALSERPDLDQTLLYDELLRRFIERELGKGQHGAAFSGLPPDAAPPAGRPRARPASASPRSACSTARR